MAVTGNVPQEPRAVGMLIYRTSDMASIAAKLRDTLEEKTAILFDGRNNVKKQQEAANPTDGSPIGEFEQANNNLSFTQDMLQKAIEAETVETAMFNLTEAHIKLSEWAIREGLIKD